MQSMVRFLTVRDPGAAGSGHAARHAEFFRRPIILGSAAGQSSLNFVAKTLEASGVKDKVVIILDIMAVAS